jgi:hypothetical protein
MIDQYTDWHTFSQALGGWAKECDHYYTKQPAIVEKIEKNGRTFYTKFRRISQAPSMELISQHISERIIMALPIIHNNSSDRIFFVYDGDMPERFVHLFRHLMRDKGIDDYFVFHGERDSIRVISIKTDRRSVSAAYQTGKELSDILQTNITKSWKILPDPSLPESYNIITLPYIN